MAAAKAKAKGKTKAKGRAQAQAGGRPKSSSRRNRGSSIHPQRDLQGFLPAPWLRLMLMSWQTSEMSNALSRLGA